jgi:hypothetical protein
VLDPREADTVEELAEIGVTFAELELRAERCSILHGDEQHPRPVIQCFSGFDVNQLDLLDWISFTWEDRLVSQGEVLSLTPAEFRGRFALLVGLHSSRARFLGFLHADHERPFSPQSVEQFQAFSRLYSEHLELLMGPESERATEVRPAQAPTYQAQDESLQSYTWMDCV